MNTTITEETGTAPQAKLRMDPRRLIALVAAAIIVGALATVDGLVAVVIAALLAAVYSAVRWRGPRRLRRVAIATTGIVSLSGIIAALALPVYAQRTAPLIVNLSPEQPGSTGLPLGVTRPSFEVLGYVASDYEDSSTGVDTDVSRVTALAPTGSVPHPA